MRTDIISSERLRLYFPVYFLIVPLHFSVIGLDNSNLNSRIFFSILPSRMQMKSA
jgi:hypothetical protein